MNIFSRKGPSAEEMKREDYIRRNITSTLSKALRQLQQQYVSEEEPIHSGDSANAVCNGVEAVFLHGLKASFSNKLSNYLIGSDPGKNPHPSFWVVLQRFTHKDVLSQLNHLGQITTEIGMCRAWVRLALNDSLLESYLDAILADQKTIREFYKRTAFLRDEEQPGIIKTYIQGILNFRFELSYNSSVLNIWTTTPLVLAGIMEATITPRAVVSSHSDGVLNQKSSSYVEEAGTSSCHDNNAQQDESSSHRDNPIPVLVVSSQRGSHHQSSRTRVISSISYHGDLSSSANIPGTPPNTPYDQSQLTQKDIDEIRKMSQQYAGSGSASTPTSQISCPDPSDGRVDAVMEPIDTDIVVKRTHKIKRKGVTSSPRSSSLLPPHSSHRSPSPGRKRKQKNVAHKTERDGSEHAKEEHAHSGSDASEHARPELTSDVRKTESEISRVTEEIVDVKTDSGCRGLDVDEPERQHVSPILARTKAQTLPPVISDVTATSTFVEIGKEISGTMKISPDYLEAQKIKAQEESLIHEASIYDVFQGPSPQSNNLGAGVGDMRGWSSDFDPRQKIEQDILSGFSDLDQQDSSQTLDESRAMLPDPVSSQKGPEERSKIKLQNSPLEGSTEENEVPFGALLNDYGPSVGPVKGATMTKVLEELPDHTPSPGRSHATAESLPDGEITADFEVLPIGSSVTSKQADTRTQELVAVIGELCTERGLDFQNYQCKGCSRPVGMIYGKARVCVYDACYYCYECHENEEHHIPSRIIHNWDFHKHKVASHTLRFLKQVEDQPLVNVEKSNPRLYEHVEEMKEMLEVRTQLRYLKAYLFTCKQSVADDFRRQIWPKEYFYDDVHAYSLQDLLQVPGGHLAQVIRRLIKYASKHVYDCRLCSQKGFICEICHNQKVIYPFEVDTTVRCGQCKAVFHKDCKTDLRPCPKCERWRERQMKLGMTSKDSDLMDYAYDPSTEEEEDVAKES